MRFRVLMMEEANVQCLRLVTGGMEDQSLHSGLLISGKRMKQD